MDHDDVQRWLDAYVSAWRSGDRDLIGRLFTEDASYSYRPWDSEEHTVVGRESIVDSWLEDPDDPSRWEATYRPYAVDGDRAVALGSTGYFDDAHELERRYSNAFILAFEGDQCSAFHEFYVRDKR